MRDGFLTVQESCKHRKMKDKNKPCGVELKIRDVVYGHITLNAFDLI